MKQLAPPPLYQFFDANRAPLDGGLLYTYIAGTTTPLQTFTDSTGVTPNTNPIVLDANGECVVWIGPLAYKFVLTDSLGVVQWTRDNIQIIPDGSIGTTQLANLSVTTAKLALAAVEAMNIADGAVGTAELADDSVTPAKIPDGSIPPSKLEAATPIVFVDRSGPRFGGGPTGYPRKPWSAPILIGSPSSPALGDGLSVKWSPNGKILVVAENNADYAALFSRFGIELVKMSPAFFSKPSVAANSVSWSPDTQYLLILAGGSTLIYQRGKNSFSKCVLSGTISGNKNAGDWNPNGNYFAVVGDLTPFVAIFKRSDQAKSHAFANYTSNNAQAVASATTQIVNYEDLVEDNMGAVSTGAGTWTFVAPRANTYRIEARATLGNSTTYSDLTLATLAVYRGGSKWAELDLINRTGFTTTGDKDGLGGSISIDLDAFETIQIKITENSTSGTMTLSADGTKNFVTITEDDGFDILSSFAQLSDPAAIPTGSGKSVKWSPDGMFVAVGHDSPAGYTFTVSSASANVGAVYSNNGVNFTVTSPINPGTTLLCTSSGAPLTSGTLTKVSGTGDTTITFSSAVAFPIRYLTIYERSGDTLAKCTDPVALPPGIVNGLDWSPDGLKLTCVHQASPFITTYSRTSVTDTTFVKVATNPNVLPAGIGNGCEYNSAGDKLAVAHD